MTLQSLKENKFAVEAEKLLQDYELRIAKELEKAKLVVKLGSMFGLMGTLIPNGGEESGSGEYAGDYQEGAGDKGDEYDGTGRGRTRQEVGDCIPADNGRGDICAGKCDRVVLTNLPVYAQSSLPCNKLASEGHYRLFTLQCTPFLFCDIFSSHEVRCSTKRTNLTLTGIVPALK